MPVQGFKARRFASENSLPAPASRGEGEIGGNVEGVLPKSIWKDEFHESLILIPRFPEGNGDSRISSLQRIGVFLLGNTPSRCARGNLNP